MSSSNMHFSVPQFIDIEDKIIGGFLTFKQTIYILGGAGACVILWKTLPSVIAIPLMFPFAGLAVAFAFYKVNNRSFMQFFQAAFTYYLGNKLYVWKREPKKKALVPISQTKGTTELEPFAKAPELSESKLRDVAWSLDINQNIR